MRNFMRLIRELKAYRKTMVVVGILTLLTAIIGLQQPRIVAANHGGLEEIRRESRDGRAIRHVL